MIKYFYVALPFLLSSCDGSGSDKNKELEKKLIENQLSQMVDMKSGTFQMGDFGRLIGEKLPLTGENDDEPLHDVTLSDFSIGKYKVTYKDYDIYTEVTGKDKLELPKALESNPKLRAPDMPVSVTWDQANEFCLWLGRSAGKNISLPTEAQWEYSARSGGAFILYATGSGGFEYGKDIPSSKQRSQMTDEPLFNIPVGKFPPVKSGLYDMAGNGVDWVKDWYNEKYYRQSPKNNPQGPENGTEKVVRGYQSGGGVMTNQSVYRQHAKPYPGEEGRGFPPKYNFRCVVNK